MKLHTIRWGIKALLFLICSFPYRISAQTFRLRSIDGTAESLRVNGVPVNYSKPQGRCYLSVVHGTDTVFVYDAWASGKAKVLNQQFLQLDYPVRGGSNQGLGSTLILCVAKGKLCQALKLPTYSQSDLYNPDDHTLYQIRLRLAGTTPQAYRLHLTTHDESRSERDPLTNHNTTTQAVLKFDTERHIFYSGFKRVSSLLIFDDKIGQLVRRKVTQPLPVIEWNTYVQYFTQGEWYEEARDGK